MPNQYEAPVFFPHQPSEAGAAPGGEGGAENENLDSIEDVLLRRENRIHR